MSYTTIIGLEVHVQLNTKSKLFCGCVNLFNPDHPNVQTCPVCIGLPGSLPVMNRTALELALKIGLALNCDISRFTKWDRKQYYYPDLPKAYQISQYDLPFSHDGRMEIVVDAESGQTRTIGITRAHLEEDAGKNIHDESGRGGDSRVDLNRCGTPLVEIVSEPDLRSAQEARRYLEDLKLLMRYLDVSDCNMQEGSLRCDANVNLHIHAEEGQKIATPIVEVKNLNSFRGVEAAIQYEVQRQWDQWQETGNVLGKTPKETRGWDAQRGVTLAQRGKEEASDYRYFPDPDLIPVTFSDEQIEEARRGLCEFPADRRQRFCAAYQLSDYDSAVIIDQGPKFADYFEAVARECGDGKQAANWVTQKVLKGINERKQTIDEFPIHAELLSALLSKVAAEQITLDSARTIFDILLTEESHPEAVFPDVGRIDAIIKREGLARVADTGQLEAVVDGVIARNEKAAEDFRSGKQAAIGALIGQVLREMKGADAKTVRQMLIERITQT